MSVLDHLISEKPLSAAINEYLIDLKLEYRSPRTLESYQECLAEFQSIIGDQFIGQITLDDILDYLQTKIKFQYALNMRYRNLRAFFNWCIR